MRNEQCWYKDVCTYDTCVNCIRFSEMKYLIENSGIPKNRQVPISLEAGVDYNAFCTLADIKEDISAYVDRGDFNLYICSENTGNGKTSWAIKLLLKYFDDIWAGNGFRQRGWFQHVPTLFNTLKNFSQDHSVLKNTLETVDIVVWDDIASTKLSEYDISQLLIFIDQRIADGKANIFTGNIVSESALQKIMGSRLASRIWHTSIVVQFSGKDRR